MNEIKALVEAGTKVKYCLPDAKGKMHWFNGVVHAVRNYENENQVITKTTYLVDTNRDERVDEFTVDPRGIEIGKQLDKEMEKQAKKGGDVHVGEALKVVLERDNLPESDPQTVTIRQPEQLELPASQIKVV